MSQAKKLVAYRDTLTHQISVPLVPVLASDAASKDYTDGAALGSVGLSSDTEVLFNDGGTVDGIPTLTYDGSDITMQGNIARANGDLELRDSARLEVFSSDDIIGGQVYSTAAEQLVLASQNSLFLAVNVATAYLNAVSISPTGTVNLLANNINMNSNKIVALDTPTADTDGTNKVYVDTLLSFDSGVTPIYQESETSIEFDGPWNSSTSPANSQSVTVRCIRFNNMVCVFIPGFNANGDSGINVTITSQTGIPSAFRPDIAGGAGTVISCFDNGTPTFCKIEMDTAGIMVIESGAGGLFTAAGGTFGPNMGINMCFTLDLTDGLSLP